jgi:hypothetical protein
MSNSDIAVHANDPVEASLQVRNWLANEAELRAPGPSRLWGRFTDFMAENYKALRGSGYSDRDIERLPIPEMMTGMQAWIARNTHRS